jgi:threonine aldolase
MLEAIAQATLNDDVFREDSTTAAFEQEIADRCGHEAAAFVITGTMANQLALRTLLTQPPHAILADAHSHIIHWEAGGVAHISGAMVQGIKPMNGRFLTLEDIQKHAVVTDDVHKTPTRVISLENTTSGTVIPLAEMRRMKSWATRKGIKIHLDGARLWEAVAAGAGTICEFAQCADVLTLDFSKNLGAPMGAMVIGPAELIQRLRRMRKSFGGGMRQAGVLGAAARQAVLENFGHGQTDSKGVLRRSHELARRVGQMWTQRGGKLLREVETNMVWLNLRDAGMDGAKWDAAGRRRGIRVDGKRVVLHHQICEEALSRLALAMDDVFSLSCTPREEQCPVRARL